MAGLIARLLCRQLGHRWGALPGFYLNRITGVVERECPRCLHRQTISEHVRDDHGGCEGNRREGGRR